MVVMCQIYKAARQIMRNRSRDIKKDTVPYLLFTNKTGLLYSVMKRQ